MTTVGDRRTKAGDDDGELASSSERRARPEAAACAYALRTGRYPTTAELPGDGHHGETERGDRGIDQGTRSELKGEEEEESRCELITERTDQDAGAV